MATLSSLPIGAKIKVPHSVMGNVIFLKADQNHTGYPENSTTLITDEIILLRTFDANEPNNTNSDRQQYGNNRYSVSNIDHWLNSTASAGQWYSPQHSTDQSPNSTDVVTRNPYDTDAGFLNGFDTRFIAAMQDTTITVARNTVTDGGGYDTLTRKVFLPSRAELFNQAENSIMEGSLLQYFQANTDAIRIAKISTYAAEDNNNKGSSSVTAGTAKSYWTRTANSSKSYGVRDVGSDGSLFYSDADSGVVGVRPLCNLNSETPVSDQPDSDGYYTLLGEIELLYNVKETATMPTAVNVELDLVKTFGCSTTVEICNNGNDTVPAWEDISTVVKSGVNHIFANKTKTADKWKVVIKIHIVRNDTVGDIKLYGVKTTFKEELDDGGGGGGGGSELDKIYGVDLVGSASPSALTRTDDAVGLNVTVGTSEITSDFDNCYPWSNIEEVTDGAGNVFVKIPKFYSKITKNADGTYKHQLSGTKHEGFDTLFKVGAKEIDYVMVGKYEGSGSSSKVYSKSGQTPLVSITMDNFRNGCKAHGAGYQQYDFLIDLILKELWLVEMATTNCQSIMYGYANDNSSAISTGATDTVATPTGSPISNTDGTHACKYRGIENPWGNINKWCDGISFNGSSVYVCTEPTDYSAGKTSGLYEYYGTRTLSDGFVKTVAPLAEGSLIQYVTAVGADESSYYCDKSWQGGTVLYCGGHWYSVTSNGLWYWSGDSAASYSYNYIGGRLCYKPTV